MFLFLYFDDLQYDRFSRLTYLARPHEDNEDEVIGTLFIELLNELTTANVRVNKQRFRIDKILHLCENSEPNKVLTLDPAPVSEERHDTANQHVHTL